jgi:hypothetical protein
MRIVLLAAAAVILAGPACSQQGAAPAAPACAAMDVNLPAELKDWTGGAALASATGAADTAKAALTLGKGYEAALLKTPQISYPVRPEKPGGSVSNGGLFEFTIPAAGNYTVAQSTPAWIDVIEDGKALSPSTFGHGPECTSIRKMVVFPMKAGKHTLQISGNGAATMKIMVAKKP